jgi:hypothetical protein
MRMTTVRAWSHVVSDAPANSNDTPVVRAPHILYNGANEMKRPRQVHVNKSLPFFSCRVENRLSGSHASVANQDRDWTQRVADMMHNSLHALLVTDISNHWNSLPAETLDRLYDVERLVFIAANIDSYTRATGRKFQRDGTTNVSTSTSDDGHLPGQFFASI